MSVATSTAIGIAGGLAAAGGVASAAIGSSAAGNAATTQANAATTAAGIQAQSAAQALQFQRDQFNTSQNNIAPWLQVGRGGLANLGYLMGVLPRTPGTSVQGAAPGAAAPNGTIAAPPAGMSPVQPLQGSNPPQLNSKLQMMAGDGGPQPALDGSDGSGAPSSATGTAPGAPVSTGSTGDLQSLINPNLGGFGSLSQPFSEQFQAPTDVTEKNDPGYQFRLSQGMKLLQDSAAAKGNLLTGGTAKAITQYGQDLASNEYGATYNRAMNEYLNRFNISNTNQTNQFNRLAALSGVGQTAASTLSNAGENLANNASNITIGSGNAQAAGINNAAAARASGYVGGANAITGGIGSATSTIGQLAMLNKLYGGSNTGAPLTVNDMSPDLLASLGPYSG
jgi:hypothetical protein